MEQRPLFPQYDEPARLDTCIERAGSDLLIPEGLATIPCTHGMHRFAGKFIPNIPRYLFATTLGERKARTVLDPFCGSGTALIEAALDGRQFVGMDIDPLAVLISQAKTYPLSHRQLLEIEKFWLHHDYDSSSPEAVPSVPRLSHWFTPTVVNQLSSIKRRCLELPPDVRRFSLVVLSSIVRRVSNADDQTQKTYVSHTLVKKPPLPSRLFPEFMGRAIESMREYRKLLPAEPDGLILTGDARTQMGEVQFDDVLTSPPYIDSVDYVYNNMLEYFWLLPELGIGSYDEYQRLRSVPMGFRHRSDDVPDELVSRLRAEGRGLREVCERIAGVSPREARAVVSFFLDFLDHVSAVRTQQQSGAYYICILGNSLIRRVVVPTVNLAAALFLASGYALVNRFRYQIRRHYMKFPRRSNSGKISVDEILVFQRL